jgi:hypothetical protein
LQSYRDTVALRLVLRSALEVDQVVQQLLAHSLDLALIWGGDDVIDRQEHFRRLGIDVELLAQPIDLVFVGRTQKLLDDLRVGNDNFDRKFLARHKVATLRRGRLQDRELLPLKDAGESAERMELDTIGLILACVEAGVCDFGVVPGLYRELEQLRAERRLAYSLPVSRLQLALLTRKPGRRHLPEEAQELVTMIEEGLAQARKQGLTHPSCSGWKIGPENTGFPHKPQFFESLAFGYYVERDWSNPDWGNDPPRWKWEQVILRANRKLATEQDERLTFRGRILNLHSVDFEIEGELFHELFLVKATQRGGPVLPDSASSFISVFTRCWEEEGIICGTWSGLDVDKIPTVYATVWSREQLSLQDLCALVRPETLRSALHPEQGVAFHTQPLERTLTLPKR